MSVRDLIMSDLLKNLAVPGPVPSGGVVAALGVAQAAAWLARAAGADRELTAEAELLRMHALRLAEKDAHAVGRFASGAGLAAGGRGSSAAGGGPSGSAAAALAACLPVADVIAAAAEAVALAERLLPGPGPSSTAPSRAVPSGKVSPDVAAVAEIARSSTGSPSGPRGSPPPSGPRTRRRVRPRRH